MPTGKSLRAAVSARVLDDDVAFALAGFAHSDLDAGEVQVSCNSSSSRLGPSMRCWGAGGLQHQNQLTRAKLEMLGCRWAATAAPAA